MNPVLIELFGFQIKYYSIFILLGVISAIHLINREAKKFDINEDFILNLIFWGLIFGFIGARLYYVLFNFSYYGYNIKEIFMVWRGGLAIHGGIIFGFITLYFYTYKYKARTVRYLDIITPGLIIGQVIGRWGNFFNQEAHGAATTIEYLQKIKVPNFIIEGMNINGVYYLPTFYFESLLLFVALGYILYKRRNKYTKVGTVSAIYLISYSVIRFVIEATRTDALLIGNYKVAQIISILMFVIGIIMLIINSRKGKFEDLYNDKNNVEKIMF